MKALPILFVCVAAIALLLAQPEPQARDAKPPVIRELDFKNFQPVKMADVLQRLKAKGVHLAVERQLDSKELEAAQKELEDLLAENGRPGARVKVDVSPIPPRSVRVTFTAVEP